MTADTSTTGQRLAVEAPSGEILAVFHLPGGWKVDTDETGVTVRGATHLAAQEPTEAEVDAAARSIYGHFPRKYVDELGYTCTARWDDLEPYMQEECRTVARAALRAARDVRGQG